MMRAEDGKGEAMKDGLGISWLCLGLSSFLNPWSHKKRIVGKNLAFSAPGISDLVTFIAFTVQRVLLGALHPY